MPTAPRRARRRGIPSPPSVRERKRETGGCGHPPLHTVYRWSFRRGRCLRSEASTLGVHRPAHRAAVSFRASDRRHWRGNPSPFYASGGLFSFNSERKEEKKRRQKLRFWISLRAFARSLSRLFSHANAVPCKLPLNVALSLLLFSLPLLL